MSATNNNQFSQSNKTHQLIYAVVILLSAFAGYFTYNALRYDFSTLTGETFKWSDFDNELIVVNYFAQWCAPCLREMPELNALATNLPENTRLFAIDFDMQPNDAQLEMVKLHNIQVDVIAPDANSFLPFERPAMLPTTYIINAKGQVLKTYTGEVTEAGLRADLQQLQVL